MSTFRRWIGNQDGNNNASNPDNWSPHGAPQPGDFLSVFGDSPTISVVDKDLAGDTLSVSISNLTLNLSHNGEASLALSGGNPRDAAGRAVVNIDGNGTLNASSSFPVPGTPGGASLSVNLLGDQPSNLFGDFNMSVRSFLTISGGVNSRYINDTTNTLTGNSAHITTNVVGSGTFNVSGSSNSFAGRFFGELEFGGSVSEEQIVNLSGQASAAGPATARVAS